MNIQKRNIADLFADPANVRKHGERNLDAIKASLRRFGQQKPIVIDAKGIVVAGNGTLAAAKALGWTEIDAVKTDLEGINATAFAIADNRTAELAEWDEDALDATISSLKIAGVPLEDIGFTANELGKLNAENETKKKTEAKLVAVREVIAECKDEIEQKTIFDLLTEKGVLCRVSTF